MTVETWQTDQAVSVKDTGTTWRADSPVPVHISSSDDTVNATVGEPGVKVDASSQATRQPRARYWGRSDRSTGVAATARRLSYLPGLDGLRAIAIIAVLLYHAELPWIPGGYLGVEVFFVLSGYLITSLLLAEWRERSSINLATFWLRRARRLLPALFVLLASTLTFTVLFLPDEVASMRGDTLAAATYVTNWYLVFGQKSYFEIMGRPSLLQHLWSLAVEEQFYLLWPLLFIVALRILRTRTRMLGALLAGIAASVTLMAALYQPDTDPSRIYYGTDTRSSALLIGCALAVALPTGTPRLGKWRRRITSLGVGLAGLAALGVLGLLFAFLDETQSFLYMGGFAVTSIATAVLVAVVVYPHARLMPKLLGLGLLRWIGQRSYSIYLWHWPVYALTRPQLDVQLDGAALLALRLGLTLGLAELSYRFVETPMRAKASAIARLPGAATGPSGHLRGLRWAGAAMVMAMLVGAFGLSLTYSQPRDPLNSESNLLATTKQQINVAPVTPGPVQAHQPQIAQGLPAAPAVPTNEVASGEWRVASAEQLEHSALATRHSPLSPQAPDTNALANKPVATLMPTREQTSEETKLAQAPTATPVFTETPEPSPVVAAARVLSPPESGATRVDVGQVTAIGDSVMLGATSQLKQVINNIEVDAVRSRQASASISLLKARQSAGTLGNAVIIHLGNNGYLSAKQFDQMMQPLSGVARVVFVNNKVPRRWEKNNNDIIAGEIQKYPNAVLVDWWGASASQPQLFAKDGLHLQPSGARLYAHLIAQALR